MQKFVPRGIYQSTIYNFSKYYVSTKNCGSVEMKEVCCVDMYLMYFFTMLLQVPTTNAMSRNKGQTKNIKNRYTRYSYSKNIIM